MTTEPSDDIRIEVFRSGTFKPMVGPAITYSAEDLAAIAASYDPEAYPAPIVVGHPTTDAPAYGWVKGFEYDADADRLYADVGDIEPAFSQAVKARRYRKVSMSYYAPDASNNPVKGTWYPKHVGFLGAAAPAVSGLKPIAFAASKEGEVITFQAAFGERGFETTASILRSVRDFIIEKFSLEEADRVVSSYQLDWLAETEISKPELNGPSYSEPKKETGMTPEEKAALEKREKDVAAKEAAITAREKENREAGNAAFAEALVAGQQLIPAKKDDVVALLNALPVDQEVSFADGKSKSLSDSLKELLQSQPKIIEFGTADISGDPNDVSAVDFASDGKTVDPAQLAVHQKAVAYQNKHQGVDYIAAVKAVS